MDRPIPSYVRVSAHRQKTVSAIICPAQYHFSHISCRTEHKSLTRPWHTIACLNAAPGTCTLSRLSLPLPLLPDMAPSGHASSQTLPVTCDPRAGWSHHSHRLLPVIHVLAGVITVTACYLCWLESSQSPPATRDAPSVQEDLHLQLATRDALLSQSPPYTEDNTSGQPSSKSPSDLKAADKHFTASSGQYIEEHKRIKKAHTSQRDMGKYNHLSKRLR